MSRQKLKLLMNKAIDESFTSLAVLLRSGHHVSDRGAPTRRSDSGLGLGAEMGVNCRESVIPSGNNWQFR
jgi:hypothetical protein